MNQPMATTTKTKTTTNPPPTFLTKLTQIDTTLSSKLHTLTSPHIPFPFLKLLEITGDGRLWFPLTLSLLFSPLSHHSPLLHSLSISLLLGLILDIVIVGLTKNLVRRPRPVYNSKMGPTFAVDHWSFPSGHASRVWFVSGLFSLEMSTVENGLEELKGLVVLDRWIGGFGDVGLFVWWVMVLGLVWAFVTSVSRVLLGRHFVLDVVVGSFVGVVNALVVYRYLRF